MRQVPDLLKYYSCHLRFEILYLKVYQSLRGEKCLLVQSWYDVRLQVRLLLFKCELRLVVGGSFVAPFPSNCLIPSRCCCQIKQENYYNNSNNDDGSVFWKSVR